jgi:hypothetical protein
MYGSNIKKTAITVLDRKDIVDYVRSFVWHARSTQGRVLNARYRAEAENMRELMNDPKNTTYKSIRDFRNGDYFWHHQKVDFVQSNLGRGYIFYFRCNGCYRRVKYLYEYSLLESPLCRICCNLNYDYKQPNRSMRNISRLLKKPYLSSEGKYMLIKQAGITQEDVMAATASS